MITYTQGVGLLQKMSKVPAADTTNTALLVQFWMDSRRTVAGINGGKGPWLEIEEEVQTTANVDYVEIPNHIRRVMSVRQQNGSDPTDVIYIPRMVFDSFKWDTILAALLGSSDVPRFCYQRDNKLYIQPVPNTTGNRVILHGRIKIRDLSIADYTTGSVVSVANGGTAVVGTGTTWATSMAGRYIRITDSDTANKGDNYWYEIASVADTTHLTLKKPYQGTAISAGTAAYTIGQITYEPEAYQMATLYRALWQFFLINDPTHPARWKAYAMLYDGGQEAGLANLPGGLIGQMLEEANESMEGPYIPPSPRAGDGRAYDYPPYYYPWQDASGFNP